MLAEVGIESQLAGWQSVLFSETSEAARDEIVQLVREALRKGDVQAAPAQPQTSRRRGKAKVDAPEERESPAATPVPTGPPLEGLPVAPPKTGVEIVETMERKGERYHTLRDLRNSTLVKNVGSSRAAVA